MLALTFGALSPALSAQDKLDREIAFVRALAEEMRFIELAKEEADRLAQEFRGAAEQDKIAQLGVQVSYLGAKSRGDRTLQRTMYKEALDKSKELIERSSDANVQLQARATLADASQEFGQFLIEELEIAREQAPDQVKDLEEEASGVFRAGIEACGKVMENLQPEISKDEEKRTDYLLLWMRKGVLMREQARAVKTDRAVLIDRAISELTDMVIEAGEETAIGLRGLFELAQCYEVAGNTAQALDSYNSTIQQIGTSLTDADSIGLSAGIQGLLFAMLQEVYVRAADVMVRQGMPAAAKLFTDFRAHMTEFGEKNVELFDVVDPRWGHLMLLAECRFLAESGDSKKIGEAMAMAQRINDKHPSDYVGVRAKAVLRDILAVQRNLVSGKLLFEVAKGEFQNKNYEEAVKGLRRAQAAMTPEEQKQLGLESYEMLGTAYGYTDRYLEAMIAFSHGLQKFGRDHKDRAETAADALDRAIGQLKRQTRNDPAFDPLYASAANLMTEFGGSNVGSKLFYKSANDLFNAKKYAEAIVEYGKIQPDFPQYEAAQVRIALAHQLSGNFEQARKALAAFRKGVEATQIDSRESGRLQIRADALATAEFAEAQMVYAEARGSEEFNLPRQPTKYPEALGKMRAFVSNFSKDGEGNIPIAIEAIGRLHADLGELDKAEAAYAQLKQKDPLRASRFAPDIFKEYQSQMKTFADELDQAIAKDKGDAAIATATAALRNVQAKLAALGLDYMATSAQPQLAVMISTMNAFEELGDWKKVDEVAQKTLAAYGAETDANTKKVVDMTVRPKIGEALLQQGKFTLAYDMLIAAEKANPTQWELKRQIARCLGGWFEFDTKGQQIREPGLDRPAEAYLKHYQEYRLWAERPEVKKYSLEWYEFQWECYWFAKQAGVKDSKYKDIAVKFYNAARSTDDFATLKSLGAEGLKLWKYFQANR